MGKVVSYPGGEKLRESDRAKRRMKSAEFKISRGEVELPKLDEIPGSQAGEIVEELRKGLPLALALLTQPIEGPEGRNLGGMGVATREDQPRTGRPVGALAIREMADDIVYGPGALAFVAVRPCFGEIAEQGVQRARRAGEKVDGLLEIVGHFNVLLGKTDASFLPWSLKVGV
jgi:hypothetical protein